jgi:hypothetical protein
MGKKILTSEDLINFEAKVAELFNESKIRAPIHLSSGGEEKLIEIFSSIDKDDFVFTTWRSHYHALLKGIPQEMLLDEILNGNSISLNFPEFNFYFAPRCKNVDPKEIVSFPVEIGQSSFIKKGIKIIDQNSIFVYKSFSKSYTSFFYFLFFIFFLLYVSFFFFCYYF